MYRSHESHLYRRFSRVIAWSTFPVCVFGIAATGWLESQMGLAVLFQPLRRRVGDFIDRRFYRRKYNAEQALSGFAAVSRDEVDLDRIAEALLSAVQETVQPVKVALWTTSRPN